MAFVSVHPLLQKSMLFSLLILSPARLPSVSNKLSRFSIVLRLKWVKSRRSFAKCKCDGDMWGNPFSFVMLPSTTAKSSRIEKHSITSAIRYRDIGSPCHMPLLLVKKPVGDPSIRTEKVGGDIHFLIHKIH